MRIEKLPAPAPAAEITPKVEMSAHSLDETVVSASPTARRMAPAISTRSVP